MVPWTRQGLSELYLFPSLFSLSLRYNSLISGRVWFVTHTCINPSIFSLKTNPCCLTVAGTYLYRLRTMCPPRIPTHTSYQSHDPCLLITYNGCFGGSMFLSFDSRSAAWRRSQESDSKKEHCLLHLFEPTIPYVYGSEVRQAPKNNLFVA